MKIKLLKPRLINDKQFFAGSVVDLEEATAVQLIADGEAEAAADGVKPRMKGYDSTACTI